MDATSTLDSTQAADFLLNALTVAHEREPFVGGLFNAYEPAVHYELFNASLARGLHDTLQEEPLGKGQTSCDLVLPLVGEDRLWVEVKMWWFLFEAYGSRHVNYEKTRGWPLADGERLAHPPPAVTIAPFCSCGRGIARSAGRRPTSGSKGSRR